MTTRNQTGNVRNRNLIVNRTLALLIASLMAIPAGASAAENQALRVHNIFSSNMVIQRQKPIKIWGWAPAGQKVSVQFGEARAEAAAARLRAVADKDLQKRALRELLKMAKEHNKPALIHSRYAWRDAFDMVKEAGLGKAVFHWYTGTSGVLRDIIDSGYYISVTPAVAYHEEHRRAVKETPLEKLLLETDCPVVYARGREGEFKSSPMDVIRSLKGAAALKGLSEKEIAEETMENAIKLFGII